MFRPGASSMSAYKPAPYEFLSVTRGQFVLKLAEHVQNLNRIIFSS